MFGLKKKIIEKENPPGMYDGIASIDCKIDYDLLTDILPSHAKIRAYENLTGITVPEQYKRKLDK